MKIVFLILLLSVIVSCNSKTNLEISTDEIKDSFIIENTIEQDNNSKTKFEQIVLTNGDSARVESTANKTMFISFFTYSINGINLNQKFILNKFLKVLPKADSIRYGGRKIIEEFGEDDYDIYIGKNNVYASNGYILDLNINEKGININSIEVGDTRAKIEKTFNLPFTLNDTIVVNNDCWLGFIVNKQNKIEKIIFSAPI